MTPTPLRSQALALLAAGRRWLPAAAALGVALTLSSTAVLAYAELFPTEFASLEDAETADPVPGTLPRVAQRIATGEPLRVVAFGSSSTEGIGATTRSASYPARLEALLRRALPQLGGEVLVDNRGIGGEAVDEMVARLDRDVIAPEPDLVIWQTGSNDPLRGVPLEHFRRATLAAVARIREAGIDVVLMEPQWCPALDATPGAYRFRDAVRTIGAELGVPVIRRSELMRDWISKSRLTRAELFASDGLHMADGGYALLAEATAAEVVRGADAVVTETEAGPTVVE
ncbi:SGNH/GDSL hydrolase family protein [Methylobacterium sp. Leaf118]|uniref:SGNH/GDSL hydrolase family protein n=1 Tax=Methylobacterium sp. Leaf118 TaxID=2876562 RepID=UPI001E57AF20|nr:SGNH/GDSL hydrolase family protein [Methylobacterium sp. Leaf118]